MTNTQTIARNTGWFSIENIINAVVAFTTSIAINRYLGPEKNSYIIYVSYIANLVSSLGGMGIPATTRKYMAEFIGMGDRGTARYIYLRTLLLQTGLATAATCGFLFWVLGNASADYKLASALLVLSMWPAMINSISAQANSATEDLSTNLPASIAAALFYLIAIAATVVLHWGVVGVGVALLCMRSVDFLVRFFPAMKRVLAWETTHAHPPGLRRRMMPFALQGVASMFVAQIVWGRSEIILLKMLSSDVNQVSFYSVAFTMAEQLLLAATIFGTAAGATIFVQYGRDKSRLPELATSTFRYIALMSIPLHFIAASLAVPALLLFYGHKFQGAAMVVALAPLLCMFKAFLAPARTLLESSERQRYVIAATVIAGVIDISVAWYLIPAHGAVGACIGNGAAQLTAVGIMWGMAIYHYKVKLPWLQVAKIVFISVLAALTAHFIAVRLPPVSAILCGGCAALIVLFGLVRLMRVLEPEDRVRFGVLAGMLPKPISGFMSTSLTMLICPERGRIGSDSAIPQPASEVRLPVNPDAAPVVLLFAYHFPPSNEIGGARPYRFYKYLKRLGFECHVITAAAQADAAAANIEYVPDPLDSGGRYGIAWYADRVIRKFFWTRSLRLRWFFLAFRAGQLFMKQRKDREIVLLSSSPPVATHLAAICLAAISGRRWIADFRDPLYAVGGIRNIVKRFIAISLARLILKRADIALANTDAMQELWHYRYSGLGGKTHIIWNGYDPEDAIGNYTLPVRQHKVLSHVGELYGGRDIRPIVNAMMRLSQSGRLPDDGVTIRQIGVANQAELPDYNTLQASQALGLLEICEPVPAEEARSIALNSDGLLLIQPQTGVQVPAKLFEYLRLGRPILAYVVRNSPSERILRQAGVPFECIYPGQTPEEIEMQLLSFFELMDGREIHCNQWFTETFDASRQVNTLAQLIWPRAG